MRPHRTTGAMSRWAAAMVCCLTAGARLPAQGDDTPAARAAADALSAARKAQRAFESARRAHLPRSHGGTPTCDVTIGRICYWDDNHDPPLPPEPPRIARDRALLLSALADAASNAPTDDWIAGQRVRYLVEAARTTQALDVARACGGTPSWCAALRGLALHAGGQDVEANAAFDTALAVMPAAERCRWIDLSPWLDGGVAKRYRHLDCAARDSMNARIWWLAQPLLARPGADVRAEFLSRQTMIRLLEHAATPYAMPWGSDLATVLVRYGWPASWALEDDGTLSLAAPGERSLIGHEPTPSFDVLPSAHAVENPAAAREDDWALSPPRAFMRYAPVYARVFTPLVHQVARFRRGDSMLVVAAYDVSADTAWGAHALRAALVLASAPVHVSAVRVANQARERDVLAALAPDRPLLLSLELFAPDAHRAARARYGLAPVADSAALSDILLLAPRDSLRGALAELLPAALGSATVAPGDTVGLYWECYAAATPARPLTVRLRVVPAKTGWLHGVASALHLASNRAPIALEWSDVGQPDGSVGRTLRLGLRGLPPGRYRIEITAEGRAAPLATTSRAIEVRRRESRR